MSSTRDRLHGYSFARSSHTSAHQVCVSSPLLNRVSARCIVRVSANRDKFVADPLSMPIRPGTAFIHCINASTPSPVIVTPAVTNRCACPPSLLLSTRGRLQGVVDCTSPSPTRCATHEYHHDAKSCGSITRPVLKYRTWPAEHYNILHIFTDSAEKGHYVNITD